MKRLASAPLILEPKERFESTVIGEVRAPWQEAIQLPQLSLPKIEVMNPVTLVGGVVGAVAIEVAALTVSNLPTGVELVSQFGALSNIWFASKSFIVVR